eukprot:824604-Prymnesium_polylepis.1
MAPGRQLAPGREYLVQKTGEEELVTVHVALSCDTFPCPHQRNASSTITRGRCAQHCSGGRLSCAASITP